MNKTLITAASLGALFLTGCATTASNTFDPFPARDLNDLLTSGQYQQKTDNFYVVNDSSSSMSEDYHGPGYASANVPEKLAIEKEILNRINKTIPNLTMTAGIRSFGFGPCTNWGTTLYNLPITSYSQSAFNAGIDALTCASGGSPMNAAIEAAAGDLAGTSGRIAMLILSDGHELEGSPISAMQALKRQYGDRLCVYSVWVGNKHEEAGKLLLNSLSDIAGCGFRADAENVATPDGAAEFVKNVFLKPGAPVAAVAGCESLDSDGDGVGDCNDRCPNTLKGAHVNQFGCWIVDVKFDNDKSNIRPEYFGELDSAARVIMDNPGATIEVQGHTSNTASAEYNQGLSERRAAAVTKYLRQHIGNSATLIPQGYGLTQPVDTNDTEEGRANNRRVELKVIH